MQNDILTEIAKYAIYLLGCVMLWFFNELKSKISRKDVEEIKADYDEKLNELKAEIKNVQQDITNNTKFIYSSLATKSELNRIETKIDNMRDEIMNMLLTFSKKGGQK